VKNKKVNGSFIFLFNPYDPTFILGIWHGGDWMKEIFGSSNIWPRVHGSAKLGWPLHSLI